MAAQPVPVCRFCRGKNCEHGDHCADCGCPTCGFPGARYVEPDGYVRGFCPEPTCAWEAVPGAYQAWASRQPKRTPQQMYRAVMTALGVDLPPTDEVGPPIIAYWEEIDLTKGRT